jgi:hypothetical protein
MGKTPLSKDTEFVVGEEKVLVYILAFLFFGLFLYGLIDAILHQFTKLTYLNFIFTVALVPAIIFFRKGKSNRAYIRINKTGIYQDQQLVTAWSNFLNAYITQKEKLLSIQDNFVLVIEYFKNDPEQGFRRKIPLTNTQNKSEEHVLEAIIFYWNEYRNG